jgi:hypothetical protein
MRPRDAYSAALEASARARIVGGNVAFGEVGGTPREGIDIFATGDQVVQELSLLVPMAIEVKLRPIHQDMLEVAQLFDDTAYQLRRLGRGSIRNGTDSLLSLQVYKFGDKIRTARSFQRDVCFEMANRLEEYARTLELHIRRPRGHVS